MNPTDDCAHLLDALESKWNQEIDKAAKDRRKPSIMRAFIKAYWCRFISFTLLGFFA